MQIINSEQDQFVEFQHITFVSQVQDSPDIEWVIMTASISYIGFIDSVPTEKEALDILEDLKEGRQKYGYHDLSFIQGHLFKKTYK